MVARTLPPESHSKVRADERPGALSRLFLGWRRLLTRLLVRKRGGRDRSAEGRLGSRDTLRLLSGYVRDPATVIEQADPATSRALRRAGMSALVAGMAIAAGIGLLTAKTPVAVAIDAAWVIGWAIARLAVLRLALGGEGRRGSVSLATIAGLLPFALAIGVPLDQIALLASWRLTLLGLHGTGVTPRAARTATLLAFGGQLAVEAAAWLARGGVIALLGRF